MHIAESQPAIIYTPAGRLRLLAGLVVAVIALAAGPEMQAQSLRGSAASVEAMHRKARARGLAFHRTSAQVRRAVEAGTLVKLGSNRHYTVTRVSHPYVHPTTRLMVQRLAQQYHSACGERLVVTSAVRPVNGQPRNGSARSVHPTGMAVDLRKPTKRSCLTFLRKRLLELEAAGTIEATEEFRPPHFHVAVYGSRPQLARVGGGIERSDADEGDMDGVRDER